MKKVAVCGAGGFIGWHLCKRLRADGHYVIGYDRKYPEFAPQAEWPMNEMHIFDLTNDVDYLAAFRWQEYDEVYQLAAEMGGAGYIFTGEHDAEIMQNSARINLNTLEACRRAGVKKVFFMSSACVYNSMTSCAEHLAGDPDSSYGYEKLFAEQLYLAYARQYGMEVRIARAHNIFGPYGTWQGGREKAPAAFCRKIAEVDDGGTIECYGDGEQLRSFLYVDECVEGIVRLMESDFTGPVNLGSSEMVSINALAGMIADISGKTFSIRHIPGPLGVQARNSDNRLCYEKLGWKPSQDLRAGLEPTYRWIADQVERRNKRLAEIARQG